MSSSRRVRTMTPTEIRFRILERTRAAVEDARVMAGLERWSRERLFTCLSATSPQLGDAQRASRRRQWTETNSALRDHFLKRQRRFPLDPVSRDELSQTVRERHPEAASDAVRRAEACILGRYDFLGYSGLRFDTEAAQPDWHFDPVHDRRPPRLFWTRMRYLDPAIGDHKIIWELNRHQHWLMFGRAAWLANDAKYARAFAAQLRDWMSANPPLMGINWASMLELAFRSLSWIWALHLFSPFGEADHTGWLADLLVGIDRQLQHVVRHLSVYFSPNTHLLGEGLALYVAGRVLPELRNAGSWETIGREILLTEARTQVLPDGGHAERSTHYQRYATDFYLLALAVARRTNDPIANALQDVVSRMATFCRAMADTLGTLPTIGDDDGGMLFPMCGRPPRDVRDTLWISAALLDRPELAIGEPPEELLWMGVDAKSLPTGSLADDVPSQALSDDVPSQAFLETGYVIVRSRRSHAIVDVGPHGFLNGGHAHADALSLVLTIDGHPLLIDPGTATYTMNPAVRDTFRSTAMHNTATVDGRPQSVPAGPFHWQTHADARLLGWWPANPARASRRVDIGRPALLTDAATLDYVEAEHSGYLPLRHRRALVRVDSDLWLICDTVLGAGDHLVETFWHLHPDWALDTTEPSSVLHGKDMRAAIASTAGAPTIHRGDDHSLGLYAPAYGQTIASTTISYAVSGSAPLSVVTAIASEPARGGLRLELAPAGVETDAGWHATAAIGQINGRAFLALFTTPVVEMATATPAQHRVTLPDGNFLTDARCALLGFDNCGEPVSVCEPASLDVLQGTRAVWTGKGGFDFAADGAAANLHFDLNAARASTEAGARR